MPGKAVENAKYMGLCHPCRIPGLISWLLPSNWLRPEHCKNLEPWILSTTPGPRVSSLLVSLSLGPYDLLFSWGPCASISSPLLGTCSSLSWSEQTLDCPHPCTSSSASSLSWNSGAMDPVNHTWTQSFILAGFTITGTLRPLVFLGTLCIYLLTIAGNLFIIVLVRADSGLSTPMYFFISILSFLELWYVSTTVPTLLHTLLHGCSPISSAACFIQLYVFHSLGMTECYLLGVMALDRYLAICRPLRYPALMSRQVQLWLALASWAAGFSAALVPASLTATLPFCLKVVVHYFCDLAPLMQLACVDTSWHAQIYIVVIAMINICDLVLILGLYGGILKAILKLPSAASRAKAFSTCSSHITVVALFFGSAFIVYVGPPGIQAEGIDKIIALVYSLLTPFLNPVIYTLRNKEVKEASRRVTQKIGFALKRL
nr:olfactory receptor 10C1 [Oryctolagus cuniculus]